MTRVRLALGGLVTAAALTVGPGLGILAIHAASAEANPNANCVGQVTSGLNSTDPGAGGQNNKNFIQSLPPGQNFGQTIASTDCGTR